MGARNCFRFTPSACIVVAGVFNSLTSAAFGNIPGVKVEGHLKQGVVESTAHLVDSVDEDVQHSIIVNSSAHLSSLPLPIPPQQVQAWPGPAQQPPPHPLAVAPPGARVLFVQGAGHPGGGGQVHIRMPGSSSFQPNILDRDVLRRLAMILLPPAILLVPCAVAARGTMTLEAAFGCIFVTGILAVIMYWYMSCLWSRLADDSV